MVMERQEQFKKEKKRKADEQREIYKHYPRSHQIIIFIHGIIEGPKQFRRLAQIAYEEQYSIYVLLLPGHGGSGRAFEKIGYKEWVEYVSEQIKRIKRHYDEIILVGHSMGALLCLCEAANFPNKIRAMVLLDTPLWIHLWPRVVIGAVRIEKGEVVDEYTQAECDAISVKKTKKRSYIRWLIRYSELFSLIRYTRKQIGKIKLPILVIFARKDEFVSLRSKRYFDDRGFWVNLVVLKDSGHFAYDHDDLLLLELNFRKFIEIQKRC